MKTREFGADAVRVMALCLLLWLHFFLRNGFYSKPVADGWMVFAVGCRITFMCCVPMFMMLTGYLKCGREYHRGWFRSLLPMIISWVIISFICLFYDVRIADQHKSVYEWAVDFFNFDMANYSWYIEMYIGISFIMPILNMAWNHAQTQQDHLRIVFFFMLVTFIPTTVDSIKWSQDTTLNFLPNYWTSLWLITYYYIGCYIKTYRPRPKRWQCLLMAVSCAVLFACINFLTADGGKMSSGYTISYGHLGTAVITVSLFLAVYQLHCRSAAVSFIAKTISGVVMEMYLISCVFDQKIYTIQRGRYPASQFWWRGLLATGAVFVLSFLSGFLVHQISVRLAALPDVFRKKQIRKATNCGEQSFSSS